MSAVLPELGSKISLISKADIRYEGRLYTVDPQECTIALSSVRSFGTEDRDTQFQIAPQSQIYDYILFRGSDIKDIRVVNSNLPHPNDPAIMQVQLPNGQHLMPHFPMPNMNAPPQPSHGPQHAINSVYGNPFGGIGGNNSNGATLPGANGSANAGSTGAPNQTMPQQGTGLPAGGQPFIMGNNNNNNQEQQDEKQEIEKQQQKSQNMQQQVANDDEQQQQQQQQQQHNTMSESNLPTALTLFALSQQQPTQLFLHHQQQRNMQQQFQQAQIPPTQQQHQQQQQQIEKQLPPPSQQQQQQQYAQSLNEHKPEQQTELPAVAQHLIYPTNAPNPHAVMPIRLPARGIVDAMTIASRPITGELSNVIDVPSQFQQQQPQTTETKQHATNDSSASNNFNMNGITLPANYAGMREMVGRIGTDNNVVGGSSYASVVSSGTTGGGGEHEVTANMVMNLMANAAKLNEHKDKGMLAGASRSTTPISLLSRKSPSADMATQVNPQQVNQQQQQQGSSQQHHHQQQQHVNHHQQQQLNNASASNNVSSRDAGHKRQQNHHMQRGNQHRVNNNDFHHAQHHQQQVRDRRDSGRNNNVIDNNHINNKQQSHDANNARGGGPNTYNNNNNYQRGGNNQARGWTMHRGQNNANAIIRNRVATGRNAGPGRIQNPNYRQIAGNIGTGPGAGVGSNQNKMRNPKNTIKFEQDFDFEQANNKFEELRSQLSKLKVGEDGKTEPLNGELDKKDDSGNETGAGEQEHEDEEVSVGYDKTKSFFDNISCEAAQDRSKNKKNDWRQERKLNSETFGVSSTRRGGYRGRGGQFYNRAVGNYINAGNAIGNNGGGYNRTYRNTNNNYRNRNMRMGGGTGSSRDANVHTNNHNAATAANNANPNNAVASNSDGANDNNKISTETSVNTTQTSAGGNTTTVALTTTNLLKQLSLTATTSSVSSPTTSLSAANAASGTPAASVATPSSAKNVGSSGAADVSKGATPKPQLDGKSPAVNNNATPQSTAASAVAASQ